MRAQGAEPRQEPAALSFPLCLSLPPPARAMPMSQVLMEVWDRRARPGLGQCLENIRLHVLGTFRLGGGSEDSGEGCGQARAGSDGEAGL